jgi:hypothetical protein
LKAVILAVGLDPFVVFVFQCLVVMSFEVGVLQYFFNCYSLLGRKHEDFLDQIEQHGIVTIEQLVKRFVIFRHI